MNNFKYLPLFAYMAIMLWTSPANAQSISILSDGKTFPIEVQQTQTELKPGWKIVDIQLKSKMHRYLWGKTAKQYADTANPQFIVDTDTLLLSDMVLIKLKTKKEYRRIPKAQIKENKRIYVDLSTFRIEAYGKESFLICPIQKLDPGEYIFTWSTLEPIGDLGDWMVWPFCIK